jgi:hypothetical protein
MTKDYNKVPVKDNMKVEQEEVEVEMDSPKEDKPKMKKVIQSQPKKVKKSLFGRLIKGIVGPEGLSGIGTQVNEEIIIPAVKNIIFDAITSGVSRALHMDYRQPRGGHVQYNRGPVNPPRTGGTNYSNRYNQQHEPEERKSSRAHVRYGVDEFVIPDRYDASHVLTSLTENADRYDVTSIADYYELIGVPTQHTDHNYGWTIDSITKATIVPVHGGYIIKFPPVEVI